ncbi:MAG: HAMP domain-containing protein [Clostridia bacterium]|nr:HAMP domain-containing protein [Clostridia bacterium]
MRVSMMATYVAVIVMSMILLSVYIIGALTENLYNSERVKLFAKANIISDLITTTDDITDETQLSINQILSGSNIRSIIVSPDFRVCLDTNEDSDLIGKVIMREAINKSMKDKEQAFAINENDDNNTAMMSVSVPLIANEQTVGAVYLVESLSDADMTIRNIRKNLIVFAVIISILVAMLSLGLSLMTTAPIDNFIGVAKEISKGNFNIKAKEKGPAELVEMAKALNYMSAELDDYEQNRKKFVSDVSHELKTPLATIKLICDSIVTTDNPNPEMIQDFLGDLSDEVDRLTRIVERLLTLTKMDSNQNNASPTPVDFVVMLNAVIRKLTPNAEAKNIVLYSDYSVDSLEPMLLDYDKIWEAVYNIVDNAIKYTPEGGFVKLGLELKGKTVSVRIDDNGPGIPDEDKERIFERFYRLDDSRARDTGGTGLGLAITREAVLLHGGEISVGDTPEGGSSFVISLPYAVSGVQG